jgi:MFS family permease
VSSKNPYDLVKLFGGQGVSLFGSLISRIALPFLLIYCLRATSLEVAWVRIAQIVPGMVVGLAAGVLVDHMKRRYLLMVTDLVRAVLVALIPVVIVTHRLTLGVVIGISACLSMAEVLFDSAFDAYLPTMVPTERLIKANATFAAVGSVAEVGGFGLAGVIFEWLHAAATFSIDAVSFVVSSVSLWMIRKPESYSRDTTGTPGLSWRDIGDGFRTLRTHTILGRMALLDGFNNVFFGLSGVVYILYISRELHIPPILQGLLYSAGGVVSLATSRISDQLFHKIGINRALIAGALAAASGTALLVVATGPLWLMALFVFGQQLLGDGGDTVLGIGTAAVRQAHTENALLGRVRSSWLVLSAVGLLIGTVVGGQIGIVMGLRNALLIGVMVRLIVAAIAWRSAPIVTSTKSIGNDIEASS